ncbi:MBL fold metallo-hydrolase [Paenibacillus humicola]|uniref:MBL fold metallo-hydrolase n=1 Tax=Paenibacillus humicola TaxID=3110540 RepID=UPI00237B1154|nr:MBL fold metallo-hydrolase [Paenibacillus humicola]
MRVAKGLEMLSLDWADTTIHPTLVWDDTSAFLIDTGFPGQFEELRAALDRTGMSIDRLNAVILTHQDIDHAGGLAELAKASGHRIEVFAHELEKPYIEGDLPLIKENGLVLPRTVKVGRTLADGERLPVCGGIEVIFTPGHSPGHIGLYLEQSRTLVAGDSMFGHNGILHGVHSPTALDPGAAKRSLGKYLDYSIDSVVCYHGGLCRENVSLRLKELVHGT